MGRQVALLHDNSLVHGDLTTSNFMLQEPDKALVSSAASTLCLLANPRSVRSQ